MFSENTHSLKYHPQHFKTRSVLLCLILLAMELSILNIVTEYQCENALKYWQGANIIMAAYWLRKLLSTGRRAEEKG
jgi:hypothetical protein